MIYTVKEYLTTIECSGTTDVISLDILVNAILKRPANMIYCVSKDKLYGIISMGDIARVRKAGGRYVMINKNFTQVLQKDNMKARKLFREKENINALPVINENNVFLGAYMRWDDLNINMLHLYTGMGESFYQYDNTVCLVYPCAVFKEKWRMFETFRNYLISQGAKVNCIERSEIVKFLKDSNWILFVDEDEFRAMHTLHAFIYRKDLADIKFFTYKKFVEECCCEREGILSKIKKKGVVVLGLVYESNSKNIRYMEKLDMEISDKYVAIGKKVNNKLSKSMYWDFFDDLYSEEYADKIIHIKYQIETQSGCGKLRDCSSEVYNVINGERHTYGQPEKYNRTIYFVGPCYIYGHYSEDKNTIESFLQKRINETGYKIKVINCGSPMYSGNGALLLSRMLTLPLRRGDIIIYGRGDGRAWGGSDKINLIDVCYKHNVSARWMVDHPLHCNHRLNAIYAEAIYDNLEIILREEVEGQEELINLDKNFIKIIYINRYFNNFDPSIYKKVGSIVMNCNPFTYGHRYLIEQALEIVDFLIVFVVEEDNSLFSFNERFNMVCKGTADLNNVMVVPSGPFILSKTTFPEYFIKAEDKDLAENVENDIKIFAEGIAHYLNISYRFVGEEPEDIVTREYNMAMKRILPKSGIKFVEIPRKEMDGQYISASLVRKYLECGEKDKVKELIPESTYNVLYRKNV